MSHSLSLGSSPSKPPIKEFKRLKEKLRKLDRKLYEFWLFKCCPWHRVYFPEKYKKLLSLDQDRKNIRNRLKWYAVPTN